MIYFVLFCIIQGICSQSLHTWRKIVSIPSVAEDFSASDVSMLSISAMNPLSSGVDPICAFIAATNIENIYSMWSCNASGQPVTDPCNVVWIGLKCTGSNISSISLSSMGLVGTITPAIGELLSLSYIKINDGNLSSSIPSSIGSLSNLQVLNLY